jgi:hypothetical protein
MAIKSDIHCKGCVIICADQVHLVQDRASLRVELIK